MIVQKALITIFLILIYVVGFGVTFIFAMLFKRSLLRNKPERCDTFWVDVKDYGLDIDECMRQS